VVPPTSSKSKKFHAAREINFADYVGDRTDAAWCPMQIFVSVTLDRRRCAMLGGSSVYAPEELGLLRRIMDEAIQSLPGALRTADTKAKIARHLLDCAATGERDPIELRYAALADFNDNARQA
jgi:hypothetical protein